MRKLAIIVALSATIGFAANASAQTYFSVSSGKPEITAGTDYGPGASHYGYQVEGTTVLTIKGATTSPVKDAAILGGVRLLSGTVDNYGKVNILDWMRGGTFTNNSGATVGTVGVISGGVFDNSGLVNGTLTLEGGTFNNKSGGSVATATVKSGTFTNDGSVTTLNYSGGTLDNNKTVGTANVTGGAFNNNSAGDVTFADVSSNGTFINGGALAGAKVTGGGILVNSNGKTVGSVEQNGGTVRNSGTITDMTYYGGSYVPNFEGASGSIGTLNAKSSIAGNTWGNIGTLDLNGQTISLTIDAILNGTFILSGWNGYADVVKNATISVGLGGFDVQAWLDDFKGTNDDTQDYTFDAFDFSKAFGNTSGANILLDLEALNGYEGLSYSDGTLVVASWYVEPTPDPVTGAPEPATLAMFGLGLMGLGLVRARRRR